MTAAGRHRGRRPARRRWLGPVLGAALAVELTAGLLVLPASTRLPSAASGLLMAAPDASLAPAQDLLAAVAAGDRAAGGTFLHRRTAEVLLDRHSAAAVLLDRRAAAIRDRDRVAFMATLDPAAAGFRREQAQLFDNLAGVPLVHWRYHLDPAGAVSLNYALAGVDEWPTTRPSSLDILIRGDRWYLGEDPAGPGWRGLWDFGPVVTARGRSGLVLAHPPQSGWIEELARVVDAAVPVVSSVWGPDWSQQVALLVPGNAAEMTELIGSGLVLADIAAVAISDEFDFSRGVASGQRVVVHADNLERLSPAGQRVVIQHEIAHLAARASTAPDTAMWLVEGFADYIGYLDSGVPVRVAARELTAAVEQGELPRDLPGRDSFRGDNPRLGQAYQEAWLACLLIEQRAGQDGLVRLYRDAAEGGQPALERALVEVLDTTYEEFVADWRDFVADTLA